MEPFILGRMGKFATALVGVVGGMSCWERAFDEGSIFVEGLIFSGDGVREGILALFLLLGGSGKIWGMSARAGMPMGSSSSDSLLEDNDISKNSENTVTTQFKPIHLVPSLDEGWPALIGAGPFCGIMAD